MRFIISLVLITYIFSGCQNIYKRGDISLVGKSKYDSIYMYQDTELTIVANGLSNGFKHNDYDSVQFVINITDIQEPYVYSRQVFKNDTFQMDIRGDIMMPDTVSEKFLSIPKDYSIVAKLDLFMKDRLIKSVNDTIKIYIINPVSSERTKGELVDGKRKGKWFEYYDKEHKDIARISYFVNGKRHGNDSIYKKDKLYMFSEWVHGKKHGDFFVYWPNGTIKYKYKFDEGYPSDPLLIYTSAGELSDSIRLY